MSWADKIWDDCLKIATAIHASRPQPVAKPWVPPYVSPEKRQAYRRAARLKDMQMEIHRNSSEEM